jgi:hypothetical protein
LSRRIHLVAAVITTLLCASCGPARSGASGPLELGGDKGELCVPAGTGGDYAYGFEALRNTGTKPLTIENVELVGPQGVRIEEAFVLPVEHLTFVGAFPTWPAPSTALTASVWKARVKANGAVLPPDEIYRNLLLRLRSTGAGSGFVAVEVAYRVGPRRFSARSTTVFRIERKCL